MGVPPGSCLVGSLQIGCAGVEEVGEGGGVGGVGGFAFQLGVGVGGGVAGLAFQLGAHAGIGGGDGFGGPDGGGAAVLGGGLLGAGQFVGDVAGCPGQFAFVAADADAELAVAHLEFVAVGVGSAEGSPGGAPGCVLLGLAGFRRGAEGGGGVVVAGQFAVRGDGAGSFLPFVAFGRLDGDGAERLDCPLRELRHHVAAKLCTPGVGCLGEGNEVSAPVGVVHLRDPVGVGVAGRVEGDGLGDAVVQDVAELAGAVQRGAR